MILLLKKDILTVKIGIITDISRENVTVQCANEIEEIVTEKEMWDNVKLLH